MRSVDTPSGPSQPAASRDRLVALTLAGLALLLRLPFVGADEGWFDEIFSIFTASQPLGDVVATALTEQTNPPGFYLLAHAWSQLGGSGIPWNRLLPALSGGIVPPVFFLACRRLAIGPLAAGAAAGLLAVAPMLWRMSLEIRAYAPLALLTALALWLAAGLVGSEASPAPRRMAALAAVQVAMVMLHYFAAFVVLGVSLAVALDGRWRRGDAWPRVLRHALQLGAPAALAIAAWVMVVVLNARVAIGSNVTWIPETSLWIASRDVLAAMFGFLTPAGRSIAALAILTALGVTAVAAMRPAADQPSALRARAVLLMSLVPLLAALAAHVLAGSQLVVPRYFTGFLPALFLVPAFALQALPTRRRPAVAIVALLWWGVAGAFNFADRWPKPDWTTLLAILAPEGRATICADGTFVGLNFIFHARASGMDGVQVVHPVRCAPGYGRTWLVYDAEPRGVKPPPQVPGLVLGPRIVLFRGLQNLDARRVIARLAPAP
jgi:uncharacterized membrane protein